MAAASARVLVCPVSGTKGKPVKVGTLRSLLRPEAQHRIAEGPYLFCDAQGCEVVYFAQDGSHVFTRADLVVRVGVKETEAPRPICYCFGHTVEEIFDEIRRTGRTTVLDAIKRRLKTEGCDCEHTNPQGSCCLGVVARFVQEGMARYAAGAPAAVEAQGPDCCGPAPGQSAGEPAADCCTPPQPRPGKGHGSC